MVDLDREYHMFGPWLLRINDVIDIPKQYRSFSTHILSAEYTFKVPIHAIRRNLSPGMLMYEKIVMLFEDRLEVYTHNSNKIEHEIFRFIDIDHLIHSGELLRSEIVIIGNDKRLEITYNSVSQDISQYTVSYIRKKINEKLKAVTYNNTVSCDLKDQQIYQYFARKENTNMEISILGYQTFQSLHSPLPIRLPYAIEKFYLKKLNDTMLLTNGKELIIIDRRKTVQPIKDVNYAFSHTFVPIEKIVNFETHTIENQSYSTSTLSTKHHKIYLHLEPTFDTYPIKNLLQINTSL